jgi:hypothetical protein
MEDALVASLLAVRKARHAEAALRSSPDSV